MAKRGLGIGMLVVAGVVVLALLPKKRPAEPGVIEPGPGEGAAKVSGTISIAGVRQSVSKVYGSTITVTGVWNGTTKNAQGIVIAWPYRIVALLGHSTTFGWKQAKELGFLYTGSPAVTEWTATSGAQSFTRYFSTPEDPNQVWDVHVRLEALPDSDQDGKPDGNWMLLQEAKADGVITSVPPAPVGAKVSGTIGITNVSQRKIGRFGL